MKVTFDATVTVTDGEFKVFMGQGLTSFFEKDQSRFVLKTTGEVDRLINMLTAAKAELISIKEKITASSGDEN